MRKVFEVRNLSKRYKNIVAIDNISFDIFEKEIFAFLGPNGAGKSTTINILSTLLNYDEGRVLIHGYDLKKDADKIRNLLGVVFQDGVLDDLLSVKDNLLLRARMYGLKGNVLKKRLAQVCSLTKCDEILNRKYGQLSGGQKRRVDIARALMQRPKILFLDEPTTGLDPAMRKHIWQLIKKINEEENATIFFSTHYMEEVENADHVVIIDNGQIKEDSNPLALKQKYCLDKMFLYTQKKDHIMDILNKNNYCYKAFEDHYEVEIKDYEQAKKLFQEVKDYIDDFQFIKGSMDDVFLNITGKELRK